MYMAVRLALRVAYLQFGQGHNDMKINELVNKNHLDEIDRRGFLKGMAAAGVGASLPNISFSQGINPKITSAAQKFLSIIKTKKPNSVVEKITFVKFSDSVEHRAAAGKILFIAEGKFDTDNIAVTSPTGGLGFNAGLINNQTAKLNTAWEVIFGGGFLKMNLYGGNGKPLGDQNAILINVPLNGNNERDNTRSSYPEEFGSISIKNLQMGMSRDEIKAVAGSIDNVFGFTLANEKFDVASFTYHNNRLSNIRLSVDTLKKHNERFDLGNVLEAIQGKFGTGQINKKIVKNKMGNQFEGIEAVWSLSDGSTIMLWEHAGTIGRVIISFNSPIYLKTLNSDSDLRKTSRSSDI